MSAAVQPAPSTPVLPLLSTGRMSLFHRLKRRFKSNPDPADAKRAQSRVATLPPPAVPSLPASTDAPSSSQKDALLAPKKLRSRSTSPTPTGLATCDDHVKPSAAHGPTDSTVPSSVDQSPLLSSSTSSPLTPSVLVFPPLPSSPTLSAHLIALPPSPTSTADGLDACLSTSVAGTPTNTTPAQAPTRPVLSVDPHPVLPNQAVVNSSPTSIFTEMFSNDDNDGHNILSTPTRPQDSPRSSAHILTPTSPNNPAFPRRQDSTEVDKPDGGNRGRSPVKRGMFYVAKGDGSDSDEEDEALTDTDSKTKSSDQLAATGNGRQKVHIGIVPPIESTLEKPSSTLSFVDEEEEGVDNVIAADTKRTATIHLPEKQPGSALASESNGTKSAKPKRRPTLKILSKGSGLSRRRSIFDILTRSPSSPNQPKSPSPVRQPSSTRAPPARSQTGSDAQVRRRLSLVDRLTGPSLESEVMLQPTRRPLAIAVQSPSDVSTQMESLRTQTPTRPNDNSRASQDINESHRLTESAFMF